VAGAVALALLAGLAPIGGDGLLHNVSWPMSLPPALELLGASLFFVSFVWLSRQGAVGSDSFLGWIAAGCAFAGFSMITLALAPAGKVGWVQSGDLLRGAAVGTWAIGAVTEIFSYWSRIAQAVRTETRRSLALDLHDGLAQELALLASYTYAPAEVRAERQWHEQVDATAARALAEARRAIVTLTDEAVPFEADIERTVEWISRPDVDIRVEIDAGVVTTTTDLLQREYLVRIVREAVTNAIRHGSARHIDVIFEAGTSPRLAVFDDGVGFDPARVASIGRLGLISMRERAEAIGASLAVRSVPGEGTTVEVLWP
jgi:signal transduction histidine kinase